MSFLILHRPLLVWMAISFTDRDLSFSPVVEEMIVMARLAVVVTTMVHRAAVVIAMVEMIPMVYGSLGPC
jgi:hypothetical protein